MENDQPATGGSRDRVFRGAQPMPGFSARWRWPPPGRIETIRNDQVIFDGVLSGHGAQFTASTATAADAPPVVTTDSMALAPFHRPSVRLEADATVHG